MTRRTKVAALVSTGVFMASLDLFIVNIAFTDIQADFDGTSLGALSWVLSAYAIVFAATLVPDSVPAVLTPAALVVVAVLSAAPVSVPVST